MARNSLRGFSPVGSILWCDTLVAILCTARARASKPRSSWLTPPKNRYNPPTLVVERSKFSTLVQAPRFICGVNLKSQISNLKSKSTDRFPQSTSLAKINRWMISFSVFRRSHWLGRWSAGGRKNAAMGEKSASLTKMVQQLRHSHRRLCCLWATPQYQLGARRRIAAHICRLTVKVAVTCGKKHSRRCWLSILSCCGQLSHTK